MADIISVVYHDTNASKPLSILPATSKRFSDKGWIAKVGDRIVVHSADHSLITGWSQSKQKGRFSNESDNTAVIILTVIECVYDYSLSDVGIICECLPF
jgi:hypothetical protein